MLGDKIKELFQRFWPVSPNEPVEPYRLGQILLRMSAITEQALEQALAIKEKQPHKLLGQILIAEGLCSREHVSRAIEQQQEETRLG